MEIDKILKEYKRSDKENILHLIPIYQENVLVGYLRPITFDFKESLPGLVHSLSVWRRENPTAGTGTFIVTDERTERWLENFVLRNEKRIIFVIIDKESKYLGHIGLAEFDYEHRTADIDAVLRGVGGTHKGIMSAALKTIIAWGQRELGLKEIYLDVYDDNIHALNFYQKNCFEEVGRIALVKVCYEDEEKWEIDKQMDPYIAEKCYVRMRYKGERNEV